MSLFVSHLHHLSVASVFMTDENVNPSAPTRRQRDDALHLGPRKKACLSDPLVSHGRHFGRTVHALCNVQSLLTNGLLRLGELSEESDEYFTAECVVVLAKMYCI